MNNSSVVKKTTTEWDIFRTEQLAILKEIKKRTGEYISGKGNVMKYIGELWRKDVVPYGEIFLFQLRLGFLSGAAN